MTERLRRAWHYASWALTLVVLVVWVLFLRPQSLGGDASYVVIRGNSMEPSYYTGDLVITRTAPSYGVGDAVAYRVPEGELGAGTIVIHRIIGGDAVSGFVLQGDNNEGQDPWFPRQIDIVGKESLRIPMVGRVTAMLHQPIMLGGLAAGLMVMWIFARAPSKKKETPPTPSTALEDDRSVVAAETNVVANRVADLHRPRAVVDDV